MKWNPLRNLVMHKLDLNYFIPKGNFVNFSFELLSTILSDLNMLILDNIRIIYFFKFIFIYKTIYLCIYRRLNYDSED